MSDLILTFSAIVVTICVGMILNAIHDYFTDCRHEWGTWEREQDTEYAIVQSRVCKKCLMHQVHQARKMGDGA